MPSASDAAKRFDAGREQELEEVDQRVESPEVRARAVLSALQDRYGDALDTWSVTCFAAEWLGMMSAIPELSFLERDARALLRLVYTAHYERFKK